MNTYLEIRSSDPETIGWLSQETSETRAEQSVGNWSSCRCCRPVNDEERNLIAHEPLSRCWGRTWEVWDRAAAVKRCSSPLILPANICGLTFATIGCIVCLATTILGATYGLSYGI